MKFNLCYIDYEFKFTLKAMREFKEATGKCLWSTVGAYSQCVRSGAGKPFTEVAIELGKVLDFDDASQMLFILARQMNSLLTVNEIQDGMFHAGVYQTDATTPWQIVCADACSKIQVMLNAEAMEKKRSADSSQLTSR